MNPKYDFSNKRYVPTTHTDTASREETYGVYDWAKEEIVKESPSPEQAIKDAIEMNESIKRTPDDLDGPFYCPDCGALMACDPNREEGYAYVMCLKCNYSTKSTYL